MIITGIEPVVIHVNRRGDWVFVLVYTDEGLTGLGEASHSGNDALLVATLGVFATQLVGKDPFAINELWRSLARVDGGQFERLMGEHEVLVERTRKGRQKRVNIRPFMLELRSEPDRILMRFRAGPEGTARPEEILGVLGYASEQVHALFHIERTQVLLASPPFDGAGPRGRRKEP